MESRVKPGAGKGAALEYELEAKEGVMKAGNNSVKVLALDAGVVLDKVGVR